MTVTVTDASGAALANAEVALFVVDKAMLDLKPAPLRNLREDFTPAQRAAPTTVRRASRGKRPWCFAGTLDVAVGGLDAVSTCPVPQPERCPSVSNDRSCLYACLGVRVHDCSSTCLCVLPVLLMVPQVSDTRSINAPWSGYTASRATFLRRVAADPFLYMSSWPLVPSAYGGSEVDLTDGEFLARYTSPITRYPWRNSYYGYGQPITTEFNGGAGGGVLEMMPSAGGASPLSSGNVLRTACAYLFSCVCLVGDRTSPELRRLFVGSLCWFS